MQVITTLYAYHVETIVGLEMAEYEVAETDKNVKVNVCAVVNSSRNDCPIEAVFSLKLSSFADVMDTAGI